MSIEHRGKRYIIAPKLKPKSRERSIQQIDYAATFKTLKGTRSVLVPQFRSELEMIKTLPIAEQGPALELWQLGYSTHIPDDPFPFAIVQTSRVSPRDPITPDTTIEVRRNDSVKLAAVRQHSYRRGRLEVYVWCPGCDEWKDKADFSPHPDTANGKQTRCKACRAKYMREYRRSKKSDIAA